MATEREEGLRHGLTRALCVTVILAWVAWVVVLLYYFYQFFAGAESDVAELLDSIFAPMAFLALLMFGSIGALWLCRRCDRCRRRLFAEGPHSWLRWWPGLSTPGRDWLKRNVPWMSQIPERDYRAKTLLGSYRNRAIFSMALTGHLRCQWCGHEDGVAPDYVATTAK